MPDFTAYDKATGQIVSVQTCANRNEAVFNLKSGHALEEGRYHFEETWFPNGKPVSKDEINPTVVGNVISGLPNPCDVQVFGGPVEHVVGGSYTLNTGPGRQMVSIRAPAFRDKILTIEARR